MANIILEGPDGGGKSTLAAFLSDDLDIPIQPGEGPPKAPGEIDERLRRYARIKDHIFDRHPAISQPIYSKIREVDNNMPDSDLVRSFYESKPLIIYCRTIDVTNHVVKAGEDPNHIAALTRNFAHLVALYDEWAVKYAHLIYRIGMSPALIADLIKEWRNHV